jgi:hypothetical protein
MNLSKMVLVAALAMGGASQAFAQANLVQNPSFETVSTQTVNTVANIVEAPTLWTQTGSASCAYQALMAGENTQTGADFTIGTTASLPSDGTRILISDQGPSNTSCQIYQDVAIPAGVGSATLVLDAGFTFRSNGTLGSNVSVAVTTTGGALLATVYTRTDAQGADALATQPSVDLTAYAGQTVRIIGKTQEVGSNWAGLLMDNVRLTTTPGTSYSAPSATGTGTITVAFTGGGATCAFATHQFIGAPPGSGAVPPTSPAPGIVFPEGLLDFTTSGCTAASTLTFTVTYPVPIGGATYWKYGPTAANTSPHWYVLPATIAGNTATFTITDGGLGDDDLAANGAVVDQGGPGFGPAGAVPTLSQWMLVLLGLTLLGAAIIVSAQDRRRR